MKLVWENQEMRRLNILIGIASVVMLGAAAPLPPEAAKDVCLRQWGNEVLPDLIWIGGKNHDNSGTYWRFQAVKPNEPPGNWQFEAHIPVSGAGPDTCIKRPQP